MFKQAYDAYTPDLIDSFQIVSQTINSLSDYKLFILLHCYHIWITYSFLEIYSNHRHHWQFPWALDHQRQQSIDNTISWIICYWIY